MKKRQDLVKELDNWYSKFIRLIHADDSGLVKCFTCDTWHN